MNLGKSCLATLLLPLAFACQGQIGLGAEQPPPDRHEPGAADAGTQLPGPDPADAGTVGPAADAGTAFSCGSGPPVTTQRVYDGLSPTCVTCHGAGTARPYFSAPAAFTALIAAKREWVIPGSPDTSPFLALLKGQRPQPYPQMPLGGDPFVTLAAQGKTSISLEEIACWIGGLDPTMTTTVAGPLPVARRLTAEQLLISLKMQLNVDAASLSANSYGAQSPDEVPQRDPYHDQNHNFELLGGPTWTTGIKRSNAVDSRLIQMWVNLSQRACRLAVNATPNNPILTEASLSDTSAAAPQRIRDNIAAMSWHLLAIHPSSADLDQYFDLFVAYEPRGREVAWTAVCAAMLRDPLWISW
ncbi:MAG: hypothetical protein U1E65_12090 [Myxococcota bacterium]